MNTKLLLIRFNNTISQNEIEYFRGAVVNALSDKDILFHNHLPNATGVLYTYPVIQYKRINKKAAILCFETGTESIGKLFNESNLTFNLNGKVDSFEIDRITAFQHRIQVWDTKFTYHIRKWLALNQENYEKYTQIEGIGDKILFLENILKANILSFAKGLNIFFENQIECKITKLSDPMLTKYKNVKLMMFDAEFSSNVSIPDYTGLGKGVSIGYGVTVRYKKK
jgi:hypothetical protein